MKTLAQVDIGEKFDAPIKDPTQIGNIVSAVVANLNILAGIVLMALLMWGGFQILQGAGSQDQEKVERGRKIITGGIVGFLIIFASYWIIQMIEAITGVTIL